MTAGSNREVLPDGSVRIKAGDSAFLFARPAHGVLVVTFTGYDKGQFGTGALDEIDSVLRVAAPVSVFVDARDAVGATVRVTEDWTGFLSRHRAELDHVHVLVASKIVELTVAIARHLSRTERLIQIHSDPAVYETQLAAARSRRRS